MSGKWAACERHVSGTQASLHRSDCEGGTVVRLYAQRRPRAARTPVYAACEDDAYDVDVLIRVWQLAASATERQVRLGALWANPCKYMRAVFTHMYM